MTENMSPEKLLLAGVVGTKPFEKWSFQLDDEPNLYMENGGFTHVPSGIS